MIKNIESLNFSITGETKLYGLIGCPVAHTISPLIHNSLSSALNIDMAYVPMNVESEALGDAIKGLKAIGFKGFNVTIPHKEKVIQYIDELDEPAKKFDAVNTVVIRQGKLIGYNTDAYGFYRSFTEAFNTEVKDMNVLLVGAGGAASSLVKILVEKGASSVTIANRTPENAIKVYDRLKAYTGIQMKAVKLEDNIDLRGFDVIINTTSAGMHPDIHNTVLKDSIFESRHKVVDIIYNPFETNLLRRARESGAQTLNGFGMLYYQGVLAFELWNDLIVPDQIQKNIYETIGLNLGNII